MSGHSYERVFEQPLPETDGFRGIYSECDVASCRVDLYSSISVIDHVVGQEVTGIRVMTLKVEGQSLPGCPVNCGVEQ